MFKLNNKNRVIPPNLFWLFILAVAIIEISTISFLVYKNSNHISKSLDQAKDDNYFRKSAMVKYFDLKKKILPDGTVDSKQATEFKEEAQSALADFIQAKKIGSQNYLNFFISSQFDSFVAPFEFSYYELAVADYLEALKLNHSNQKIIQATARAMIISADSDLMIGKFDNYKQKLSQAKILVNSIILDSPGNIYGPYYLAIIDSRNGDSTTAIGIFESIRSRMNKEPDFHFELAKAYFVKEQWKKSREEFLIASAGSVIYQKNSSPFLQAIKEKTKK
ncbi:MAG: hypothetical protein NT034_02520 [Candidatus Magasanikbacteria bacterium]|nr:hypothetical protein [Candidatus Magasanikbacteria bacterium]